jgi:hypothetical protein
MLNIITVSAMTPGFAKILEEGRISRYFESTKTDFQIPENACYIDYPHTWLLKQHRWQSTSHSPYCTTSDYWFEDTLVLNTSMEEVGLPITGIHTRVAPKSKI